MTEDGRTLVERMEAIRISIASVRGLLRPTPSLPKQSPYSISEREFHERLEQRVREGKILEPDDARLYSLLQLLEEAKKGDSHSPRRDRTYARACIAQYELIVGVRLPASFAAINEDTAQARESFDYVRISSRAARAKVAGLISPRGNEQTYDRDKKP